MGYIRSVLKTMIGAFSRLGLRSLNFASSYSRWLWTAKAVCSPIRVKMPSLSPTMTDGSITQWNKKEGEEVASGDVLCEVQTDKAVVALETDEDGVLAKILVNENVPNIKVGDLIAVIATPDEDWKKVAESVEVPSPSLSKEKASVSEAVTVQQSEAASPTHQSSGPARMGPAVRLLVQTYGLDASKIPSTGPHGQLLKGDVLAFQQQQPSGGVPPSRPTTMAASTPAPSTTGQLAAKSGFVDIPLTNMRKTIAKRLSHSKASIPHAYIRGVTWLDRVALLRKDIKAATGIKLSVNDFVIKACAHALRMVPEMNALLDEASGRVAIQPTVDICMAVATPNGLITPILWRADRTPITDIATNAVALAKKARDGKLQPHEFQGGNFTISNLGMFGIRDFTAIINPPQVAILAVGTGVTRAVPSKLDRDRVEFGNQMTLTLSVDSRFVDGTTAGHFLTKLSQVLTDCPDSLLSGDPRLQGYNSSNGKGVQAGSRDADAFDLAMINAATSPPPPPAQKSAKAT